MTTSSETSTETQASKGRAAFQPWQFYILLSMIAATAAVIVSRNTHPAALLLLSAAVIFAGLVGVAFHRSLLGFFGQTSPRPAPRARARDALERDKALILRSIKELEFDRNMGKVSEADFNEIGGRLRAHALVLMQDLERVGPDVEVESADGGFGGQSALRTAGGGFREHSALRPAGACAQCGTANDADAKFCRNCGQQLESRKR
ncbi:MAG TPA: zinc ribbon domain-containing protein [Vicinamibacterales bacterium]|nr:zinc ribbon domain-containing protein [Vicinamibacterales bacterium]